ncbi:MAG: peptidase E [Candidatus Gracilibacteria bacterium]|nr:peptidase E [Candidatus Peregrinibacteria bacterium]
MKNLQKKIVAIGGYGPKDNPADIKEINEKLIELSGRPKPNFLFVPTATDDSSVYISKINETFEKGFGCDVQSLLLYSDDQSKKSFQEKIAWADIIYVGGGNTLKMMNLWRRLGVDKSLKKAYQSGKVMCGVSAGSICWFDYGVSDSRQFKNPDRNDYIRVSGLGFIPALNNPHHQSGNWDKDHRSFGMKHILKRHSGFALSVPDMCALAFIGNKVDVVKDLKEVRAYKTYFKKGAFIEDPIRSGISVKELLVTV